MRPHGPSLSHTAPSGQSAGPRSDWATLRRLFPYLWRYRWRVGIALTFLISAKMANVGVPLLLKELVDNLAPAPGSAAAMLVVPVGLLVGCA